jgi:hypothetical protein
MSTLHRLQEQCYRAFVFGEADPLLAELAVNSTRVAAAIAVYQNNARETYRLALQASYPVIERLVGDDCFRGLALKYMREHPSTSGDLQNFGLALPEMLNNIYASTVFSYLADVARLEWAMETVQLRAIDEPLNLKDLGELDPSLVPTVRLTRANSAQLVDSPYPILAIWKSNQPGKDKEVNLTSGAEHVVVRRAGGDTELSSITAVAASLALILEETATLAEATDAFAAKFGDDSDADLGDALQQLTSSGLITGFSLISPSPVQ